NAMTEKLIKLADLMREHHRLLRAMGVDRNIYDSWKEIFDLAQTLVPAKELDEKEAIRRLQNVNDDGYEYFTKELREELNRDTPAVMRVKEALAIAVDYNLRDHRDSLENLYMKDAEFILGG